MRVELPVPPQWRHELTHCLHTTAGVMLGLAGLDPVVALGAGWRFEHDGEVRREEYYLPGAADDLFAGLAPYHRVSSAWHRPADAESGWRAIRDVLAAGEPVAVAADNFHLPFRPAYQDVHTNHLMVVHGFDDERDEVLVADPVPPSFTGVLPLAALTRARDSGNPARHDRDMFFTANPIGNRWLRLRVEPDQPAYDRDFVERAIAGNGAAYAGGSAPPDSSRATGLAGLRWTLMSGLDRFGPDESAVDDLFILIGAVLAVTGVHAEFLSRAGHDFADAGLLDLGRDVDRIAHHWSALRIAVATARTGPAAAVPALTARADRVLAAYRDVLGEMARRGSA